MNILVTGGSGFIGSNLIRKLKKQGHKIKNYDIEKLCDILDNNYLSNQIFKCDVVYHLAAKTNVQESFKHPAEYYQTNIGGSLNVLASCIRHGKKLIHVSSASIYEPLSSHYAQSKAITDLLFQNYLKNSPLVIFRPFNIYGLGMNQDSCIYRFIHENPIVIYGTGKQTRDFINIDDTVDIMIEALKKEWNGHIVNIGTGSSWSVLDVAKIFKKDIKFEPKRNEIPDSKANIEVLKKLYKKKLKTNLKYDIKKLCKK